MTRYTEIRDQLKTGDIVLLSGKGLLSLGIKLITRSRWSHVGMVLRHQGQVQIWESTRECNVSLKLLSNRIGDIQDQSGEIALRRLTEVEFDANDHTKLSKLREALKGRPYEDDEIELLKAAYDGPFGQNKEDLDSVFCSELVAEAYQCLGLLDNRTASNEYTPKDFSQASGLTLLKGKLGNEITLTA